MRVFATFLLLIAATHAFTQGATKSFPNNIHSSKATSHTRIKGTKIYISLPAGYTYMPELSRYQKRQDLYFQVNEVEGKNFATTKSGFTRQAIEAKGARVDVIKNIRINQLEGIYAEGPSVTAGQYKATLMFGDENFTVMIVGVYNAADDEGKSELWSAFESMYYDKTFTLDPLEMANFNYDKTITNFKYATSATNMFTFAENGKDDATNNTANAFTFLTLPQMTEQKAREFAANLFIRYEVKGMQIDDKQVTTAHIANYTALVTSSKILTNGNPGMVYQAILLGPNSSLLFMGTAYINAGIYLDKYKKTVATIRLK